jgi:hypothetical protein
MPLFRRSHTEPAAALEEANGPEEVPSVVDLASAGGAELLEGGNLLSYGSSPVPALGGYGSSPAAAAPGYGYGYGGGGLYGSAGAGAGAASAARRPAGRTTAKMVSEADAEAQAAAAAAAAAEMRPTGRSLLAAPVRPPTPQCSPCAVCGPCGVHGGSGGPHRGGHPFLVAHHGWVAPPPGPAAGECYCRYDASANKWGLHEPSCRAALLSKCGPTGSLLECSSLQALYAAAAPGSSPQPAAASAAAAFLFVDCPPGPPCSCAGLRLDGTDAPRPRARCCSDLSTHCASPFSGLDCDDVRAYCGAGPGLPVPDAVRQFVAVKTHRLDCAAPRYARAYTRFTPAPTALRSGSGTAAINPAAAARTAAGALRHLADAAADLAPLPAAACAAGSLAAAVSIAAILVRRAVLARHVAQDTIPLLSSY